MISAPNLFAIATKELSQDAFFTWLFQWSNPACAGSNPTLHECGQALLQLMFRDSVQFDTGNILSVDAGRQWDNVDVWVEIFLNDGRKVLVIIEDKVFGSEHSNQLERYKQQGIDYCRKEGFILTCIFLKIGSEPVSSLQIIREKGFAIVTRKDILQCLSPFRGLGSDIVDEFINHLNKLEDAHNSYQLLPPSEWEGLSWVGFYQFIESRIDIIKWHWVNNPSGGFWNLCLTWEYWQEVPVYMQIEQNRICYKIALGEDETGFDNSRTEIDKIQDYVHATLMEYATRRGDSLLKRPAYFVHRGNYRTLAVVDTHQWLGDVHAPLQAENVLKNIEGILSFYNEFIDHLSEISFESAGIQVVRNINGD